MLIILLISLTQIFTTTETFVPTIKSGIHRNKRKVRHMIRDGFTEMRSLFS